jgi:hypothetical protein
MKLWQPAFGDIKMDLVTALATLGQAIKLTKDLRDIERGFDAAAQKAQIAELYSALADVKMALTDASEEIHAKDRKIKTLEAQIEELKSGDICPICESGRMKVTSTRPHEHFGTFGKQMRTVTCQNPGCGNSEQRMHDPRQHSSGRR